jgi:hypothetical protein
VCYSLVCVCALQFDGIGWDGDLVLSLVLVLVGISVGGGGWR